MPKPHRPNARVKAYAPDPDAPGRMCEHPGCVCAGEYRAPKGRDALTQYWWFCLEHVRAYNANWDFYKGMTPGQIESQLRADTAWQRPSWPLGKLGHAALEEDRVFDPLQLLAARRAKRGQAQPANKAPSELREPLATLNLPWPVTLDEVKTRYKALAKLHHPDANGGDKAAEERLKTINLAYAALKRGLVPERLAATG